MARDERVTPYKLEQHLNEMCSSDPTYTNLLSTWNINKKACQDALSTVVMSYPHYTKHDISHCEAVITAIEKLLGEETIRTLSPTDTWLLLQAAYLHDIGMVIECKRIEENWKTEEFQEYLHESEESSDKSLAESAKYINSFRNASREEDVLSWPVNVRYAVTLLIADYYRRRHAKDSDLYVQDMGKVFHIDLGFNGLIQSRLVYLLADIVGLHGESCDKVLELDYVTDGFNADFAHPRFLAEMLRMGDLLDADNNRFNDTNELVFGKIPESSKNHWEKHRSVRHLLVTPDVIEYRADCDKLKVYREHRRFLTILKEEITFWTFHWKDIMPEDISGSAPKLGRCELLLNGVPDVQGISDLRFWISQEKAFEILEGANIYDDQFVFLREVIQNALDACKVQMWRDLREERYRGWITGPIDSTIQPFEIKDEIFKNYVVQVKVCDFDKDHVEVIVKDNGTGISVEQFKKICNVGVSYFGDRERKREIESMPAWLRPTAGFGIGLQSIFLVAEEFIIYSKSSDDHGIRATIASSRKGGYVEVMRDDTLRSRGTEIHVVLPRDLDFRIDVMSNTSKYIETEYDPFTNKEDTVYYAIWDMLRTTMGKTYFPVTVLFNDITDTIDAECFDALEDCATNERYKFQRLPYFGMELWDKQTCTRICIRLGNAYGICTRHCFFKGMKIKNGAFFGFNYKGIEVEADFYGLDAKETLTLDRRRVKREAVEQFLKILDSAVDFYLAEIEEALLAKWKNRKAWEIVKIYVYWCVVPLKMKVGLLEKYENTFREVKRSIHIVEKNSDMIFKEKKIDFKDIIADLNQVLIIMNLDDYIEDGHNSENLKVDLIEQLLNKNNIPVSKVIIDKKFVDMLDCRSFEKIMFIQEEKELWLGIPTIEEKKLPITIDEKTNKYLMKQLLREGRPQAIFSGASIRRHTMGTRGYETICTTQVPFGVGGVSYSETGYIISPITINQWETNKYLKEDQFVEVICSCKEFSNLLNYVYENQLGQPEGGKYTKQKIKEGYESFIREMYRIMKEDEDEQNDEMYY